MTEDSIKLAVIHEIQQDVKRILRQQELSQVLVREVADQRMQEVFGGNKALERILVYLHATDHNQSTMAPVLNKKFGVALTQPRISDMLSLMRRKGFLTTGKPPQYAPGWQIFELATYLRQQLPADRRAALKSRLDRVRKA